MPKSNDKNTHNENRRKVISDETENLKDMQGKWYKLYGFEDDEIDEKWECEHVTEENPELFLAEIGKIKPIPAYRYVINYLLFQTGLDVEKTNRKKFADFIVERKFMNVSAENIEGKQPKLLGNENGKLKKEFKEKDFQDLWQELISRLNNSYDQNGYEGTMDWVKFFSELSESFCYETLKQLAFGVHMSMKDFNVFLKMVLKRSGINFYGRDEIFVYLTLTYADKFGCGAYFQAYKKLCELYPAKKDEDIEKMKWEEGEDISSTGALKNKLSETFSNMNDSVFIKTDLKLEKALDYAAWQNIRLKRKDITRTAKRRFCELWNEIKQKCDESGVLAEIIRAEKKEQEQKKIVDGLFWKELIVRYNPKTGCILPATETFKTKTLKKSIKGNQEAEFSLPQDQSLPAVKTECVEVKVKALMPETEFRQSMESIPALAKRKWPQFVPHDFFEKLEQENSRIREKNKKKTEIQFSEIKVCTKKLATEIGKIKITEKNRPRFWEDSGKKNEGIFRVEFKTGVFIPKGTQFSFELEGVRFLYESVEDANTVTFDLQVRPLQEWGGKWEHAGMKKKDYIEKNERLQVIDEGKEKIEGLCTASIGKSEMLHFFAEAKNENCITVSCQKTCRIPQGTIFKYHYKGEDFLFESVKDVVKKPFAEAKVNAVWKNIGEFQQEVVDKKCTFLPANTKFTHNLANVYEVYAKEGTTLHPDIQHEEEEKDYKVNDSVLFRYIYQTSAKNAEKIGYYQGFPGYGDDYFLNSKLFKNTRIVRDHLISPPNDEERLRNLILTLKFLEFVWWDEEYDNYGAYEIDTLLEYFQKDYGINDELTSCGFQAFYPNFAYDAFLALLLNSADPLALFQAIWTDQPLSRGILHRKEK